VEVDADEDGIFLRILDGNAFIERNKSIRGPRHDGLHLRLAQLAIETLGHIERGNFFGASETAIRPVILSAMSGVYHYCSESFARIFRRFWRGRASRQQSQETDGKSAADQERHSDSIANNVYFTKGFSAVSDLFFCDDIYK